MWEKKGEERHSNYCKEMKKLGNNRRKREREREKEREREREMKHKREWEGGRDKQEIDRGKRDKNLDKH